MTKVRLLGVSMKNIRSVLETELCFPENGLVGIRGTNIDTGGSSGSGKSTVILGATYALGYANFPATHLKSWLTENPLQVTAKLSIDDANVQLARGKTTSLQEGEGKPVTGATAVNKRLGELLGLTPELLRALTYRPQGGKSAFLTMDDASKKDFLGSVIPMLEKFEEEAERATERSKEAVFVAQQKADHYAAGLAQLNLIESEIGELVLQDLAPLETANNETWATSSRLKEVLSTKRWELANAHELWLQAQDALSAVKVEGASALEAEGAAIMDEAPPPAKDLSGLVARGEECARRWAAAKARDEGRRKTMEAERRGLASEIAEKENVFSRKKLLVQREGELSHQLEHLRGKTCPTCERPWDEASTDEAEKELADLRSQLQAMDTLEVELQALRRSYSEAPDFVPDPVVDKLGALNVKLVEELTAARAETRVEQQAWEMARRQRAEAVFSRLRDLTEKARATALALAQQCSVSRSLAQSAVDNAMADCLSAERQAAATASALAAAESANAQRIVAHDAAKKRLEKMTERVEIARAEAEEARRVANAETDFAEMVGREGFLGAIFDEILAEVAHEANAIAGRIPNIARVVVRFRSESITEKGRIKRSIVPVAAVDGHDELPMSAACSGGMENAVHLAIDLALIRVISRRTGAMPGWLFLDEPFDGSGRVEKEAWIEVLKEYAQDRLVVVIDHSSETKELFDSMIDVSFTGGVTTISQEK
jgi:hypothetical protein